MFLARLGQRDAALADATEALGKEPNAFVRHQVASIYALTSRQNPGDRVEALRFLSSCLSHSPERIDRVDEDADLDPIRDDPDFRRIVSKARTRARKPPPSGTSPP